MAVKKKSPVKKTNPLTDDPKLIGGRVGINRSPRFRSDSKEISLLVKAAKSATVNAIRSLTALDLPVTYMEKGVVYRRNPDGKILEVTTVPTKKKSAKKPTIILKKGMILHAKK